VIAFDAHVLKWSLDDYPPDEHTRHHIKEASFHGKDVWTVDLVIKQTSPKPISVNFVGIQERAMWPGKARLSAEGDWSLRLFEKMDAWMDSFTGGTVDAMMLGCVGGIIAI